MPTDTGSHLDMAANYTSDKNDNLEVGFEEERSETADPLRIDGESAGARTQDQRLKRAMLYQLSYALKPHYQVSTFGPPFLPSNQRQGKLLPLVAPAWMVNCLNRRDLPTELCIKSADRRRCGLEPQSIFEAAVPEEMCHFGTDG